MSKRIWTVVNDDDPNDTFEVEAGTSQEAERVALEELGWWVAADPVEEEEI